MKKQDTNLTLFFTAGLGLKTWAKLGILGREVELYKRLSKKLKAVNFVTYGGKQDKDYSEGLGTIKLLATGWHKMPALTANLLLLKHRQELKETDVLKTNQIQGSEIAIRLKKRLGKKLIVRCGYLHSQFIRKQTENSGNIRKAARLEKEAFASADAGIVTSERDKAYVVENHKIEQEKIKVVPNYVVTDVFKPFPNAKKEYDLAFVGRAGKQKNLENLLKAIKRLKAGGKPVSMIMAGGCCADSKIRELVKRYGLNLTFKDSVPNFDLPLALSQATAFILPSHYEGHPKALLEAMSCGMPCIGTDVEGIREDLEHMKTGYLCGTDCKSIGAAIENVLSDEALQRKMGASARKHILKNYQVNTALEKELKAIQEVMENETLS